MACNQQFPAPPFDRIPSRMPLLSARASVGDGIEDLKDSPEGPRHTDGDLAMIDSTADCDPKGRSTRRSDRRSHREEEKAGIE